jgi:hypothetical protein
MNSTAASDANAPGQMVLIGVLGGNSPQMKSRRYPPFSSAGGS